MTRASDPGTSDGMQQRRPARARALRGSEAEHEHDKAKAGEQRKRIRATPPDRTAFGARQLRGCFTGEVFGDIRFRAAE